MNAWLKDSEINVLNLTTRQMIACACLGAAQVGFMVVLFNVYCGVTGV